MPLRWTTPLLPVLFLISVNRVVVWADSTSVDEPAIEIIVDDTIIRIYNADSPLI